MLETPSYRESAGKLRDSIQSLPEPSQVVPLLERLAREKKPIISE